MHDNNIIAIEDKQHRASIDDFQQLMLRTEAKLNLLSKQNPKHFHKMGSTLFEKESCECLKSVCDGVIFKSGDVQLISGHSFPDILVKPRFGVEIKSTIGEQWTSTGSSIVESSRLSDIDEIFMLFGKLGSNPPEFKCRPYCEVLKEIHVTHSPRYTIDMQLNCGETIFDKMHTTYNDFRNNADKINIVRNYYRNEAIRKKSSAVPWWLETDSAVNMDIMRTGMDSNHKKQLIAEMLILFDGIINGDYDEAAVWLCTRRNTINPSFRDPFSAGGTCKAIDGCRLDTPYPHIVGTILEHRKIIEDILTSESIELLPDIYSVWQDVKQDVSLYTQWIERTDHAFKLNNKLSRIKIADLIHKKPTIIEY